MKVDKTKWRKVTLGKVGQIITGATPSTKDVRNYESEDISFFKPGDLDGNVVNSLSQATDSISYYGFENSRKLPSGAILITCIGIIGKVGVLANPATCNQQINTIICNSNFSNRFIAYNILYHRDILSQKANGPVVPIINKSSFSKYVINVPQTLEEQQAIASELDAIQTMIDGYKAQITDLDVLAQSIFLDMFGDPVANPKGWEITVLNDLCTKITDGTHLSPKWVDSGIPFIFVANIKNFEINFDVQKYIDEDTYEVLWKSTPIELGDIVYSSVGSYGNPAIVSSPQKFMFQRHIALLKPLHDKINNVYLKWFLISEGGKKQADDSAIGVAQKTLNLKAIKNFHIPVPPLALQQHFAAQVEAIEKQKELIKSQLADAEQLMAERMQYYFS